MLWATAWQQPRRRHKSAARDRPRPRSRQKGTYRVEAVTMRAESAQLQHRGNETAAYEAELRKQSDELQMVRIRNQDRDETRRQVDVDIRLERMLERPPDSRTGFRADGSIDLRQLKPAHSMATHMRTRAA